MRYRMFGLCAVLVAANAFLSGGAGESKKHDVFARDNLVAWCIVPFDSKKRGPAERIEMLNRLGFRRFAYDWRAEHLPTFDAELKELKRRAIALDAVWFPAALSDDAKKLLDGLRRHGIKTQLWITMGDPAPAAKDQSAKIEAAARVLRPIAEEAAKIGCRVALYNHGGWFGEPENQIAVIKHLQLENVGIVYNLHHGHDHLPRFAELLDKMKPHLWALNLNGMVKDGDKTGKKILPLAQGDLDLQLLKKIRDSGYRGPIGILGHTMDDAEDRLRDNLEGLDWLVPQLNGKKPGPRPRPRTHVGQVSNLSAKNQGQVENLSYDAALVAKLIREAKASGDVRHGAVVFGSPQFACLGCHKIGKIGGTVGPDLTVAGRCYTPEQIVEGVLWPKRQVKDEFKSHMIVTSDGKVHQGYLQREDGKECVLRDPATGKLTNLPKAEIDERREVGTLMPDGLAAAMTGNQLRDLLRFLMSLGHTEGLADLAGHSHTVASLPFDRSPLDPKQWPSWQHYVNRDRAYDFYAREADYFRQQPNVPILLPEFPGLDGPKHGHWGNQSEKTWADDRWNLTDLGTLMSGAFHGPSGTVPRGVCVRLGERGELSVCFNPDTLCYEALWEGGFVKFSSVRHGFLHGLKMDGKALPRPEGKKPQMTFVYHGFYRHGKRVLFSYSIDGVRMLDAPWVANGQFERVVAPADKHSLAHLTRGGPQQWPQVLETRGTLGSGGPYVIDTIALPFENPWNAPLFFGDHDFLPDGSALLCTMQGDVWRVEGLDDKLERVRWRRFASGLHQALGLIVADGQIYVLGRDQITRLHDLNKDGETDFYECFSNAYFTSSGGHDYICGLKRDPDGRFYTASSKQGLVRVSADGKKAELLATGFRNPDGVGLYPDGAVTVPCSEGEWTPASMLCLIRPGKKATRDPAIGGHMPPYFGYGGPKDGRAPDLPFVYLPRGVDNSSGGQVYVTSDRWGPLKGQMIHFSYGACSHMLLLRDEVDGQAQGGVVPLPGEFLSGAHRGRFHPKDGQLYVTGMAGWGTYAVADGCFHRVRYTGAPVHLPNGFHVHENGIRVTFTRPVDRDVAGQMSSHFAQCWNYRYSAAYGSAEYSPRHPGVRGHDHLEIVTAHVAADGRSVFFEIPDIQPVNQLHLRLRVDAGPARDLFLTVHRMDKPFTDIANYKPVARTIAAHPILADLRATAKPAPNPWRFPLGKAQAVAIHADKNLTFAERSFTVKPGQAIKLTLTNPDTVPHNWVLVKPGALERVGDLSNRLIADPDAAIRHYVPKSDDVLCYTDVVPPESTFTINFRAPKEKGRYPYLCTFPGHWMVMNGHMIVE
ncbi:MAG: TIM barrel protein [Gemmataceae bacterium]|nr:TIM barrel protein [Gemmataceae bacterium]